MLADLIRQPRDLTQAAHPILKILPEVDSQPPARLLQARKRVPCTSPQLTAGAAADLPLLHVIPDVPLAQVVVQWHLRPLQHQQQLRSIRRHPFQHPVDRGIVGPLRHQVVKLLSQRFARHRIGCLPVRLQTRVQLPDPLPDLLDGLRDASHCAAPIAPADAPHGASTTHARKRRTARLHRSGLSTPATPRARSNSPATPLRWRSARAADRSPAAR